MSDVEDALVLGDAGRTHGLEGIGSGSASANDPSFAKPPIAVAIDEMAAALLTASTGQPAHVADELKLSGAELVELSFDWAMAPDDRPNPEVLQKGFSVGLDDLRATMPEIGRLAEALKKVRRSEILAAASKIEIQRPLANRKLIHPAYDSMLRCGEGRMPAGSLLPGLTVASLLLSWVTGSSPDRRFLNRVKKEFARKTSGPDAVTQSKGRWTRSAQEAALIGLVGELRLACRNNPVRARRIGVVPELSVPAPKHDLDRMAEESSAITARWGSSSDYMRPRARQAAGGHGFASPEILFETGCLIRSGAATRPQHCLVVSYEILFNITPEMAHTVVLIEAEDQHPLAALAVHLASGSVRASHEWLIEQGRKPMLQCLGMFESTTRWCWIALPPWWADAQRALAAGHATPPSSLGALLDCAIHHPKADLLGRTTGYRITVNKTRESLPGVALADGIPRAVAAVALSQFGLVSPGRMFYGMVSGQQINKALSCAYRRLGWLRGNEKLPTRKQLFGSAVVPTVEAVAAIFSTLCNSIELACEDHEARPSLDTWLRRHGAILAFVACVAELCLCLRRAESYVLAPKELTSRNLRPHINDKAVHPLGGGPAAGKPGLLVKVIDAWTSYLKLAAGDSILSDGEVGQRIAVACMRAASPESEGLLVAFDQHGHCLGAGSATWMNKLPPHLQIGENFARHFWPYHLHEAGLVQWHLDYLLRHRLNAWEHETSDDPVPSEKVRQDLVVAMDSVIVRLQVKLPRILLRCKRPANPS